VLFGSVQKLNVWFIRYAILVTCVTHHLGALANLRCANKKINLTPQPLLKSRFCAFVKSIALVTFCALMAAQVILSLD
jgi:hypothetical protein